MSREAPLSLGQQSVAVSALVTLEAPVWLATLASATRAAESPAEASVRLAMFYKVLTVNPNLAKQISSEKVHEALLKNSEELLSLRFDINYFDEIAKADLVELAISVKHYGIAVIFLLEQIQALKTVSTDEAVKYLQAKNTNNRTWFSKVLILSQSIYKALTRDVEIIFDEELDASYRIYLQKLRAVFIDVVQSFLTDPAVQHAILADEYALIRGDEYYSGVRENSSQACPVKLICDATTISSLKASLEAMLADCEFELAEIFGLQGNPAASLKKIVAEQHSDALVKFIAHFPRQEYLDAFADEFKRQVDCYRAPSAIFMLEVIGAIQFKHIEHLLPYDLVSYVLEKIAVETKKIEADADPIRKTNLLDLDVILVKMLSFQGDVDLQLRFLCEKYFPRYIGVADSETVSQQYLTIKKFIVRTLVRLSSTWAGLLAKKSSPTDKFKDIVADLAKQNLGIVARSFWAAYLFFRLYASDVDEARNMLNMLEKILEQLVTYEKKFPELKTSLLKKLLESNYYSAPTVEYALKYVFADERHEAEAIANAEAERATASWDIDFDVVFGKRFAGMITKSKISPPFKKEIVKALAAGKKNPNAILANLGFFQDLLAWSEHKLKSVQLDRQIIYFLLANSSVTSELLKLLGLSINFEQDIELLDKINEALSTKDLTSSIDTWLATIVFDEDTASQFLILHLLLVQLTKKQSFYQPILLLMRSAMRAGALAFNANPEKFSSWRHIFNLAAKHYFFKTNVDNDLVAILLERYDSIAIPLVVEKYGLDSEADELVMNNSTAVKAKKGKRRKNKAAEHRTEDDKLLEDSKPKQAEHMAVMPTAAIAGTNRISPLSNTDVRSTHSDETHSLSPSVHSLGSGDGSLSRISLAGDVINPAMIEKMLQLQTLRANISENIEILLKGLTAQLAEDSNPIKIERVKILQQRMTENSSLMKLLRNGLKKMKEGGSVEEKEFSVEAVKKDAPKISPWARSIIESTATLFRAMVDALISIQDDEIALGRDRINAQILLKRLQNFYLPRVLDETADYLIELPIKELQELVAGLIEKVSTISSEYFIKVRVSDIQNFWSLLHRTNFLLNGIVKEEFAKEIKEDEFLVPKLSGPDLKQAEKTSEHASDAIFVAMVNRFNRELNAFVLCLADLEAKIEFSDVELKRNMTNIIDKLRYFCIYPAPIVEHLSHLLAKVGCLKVFGSQLTMDHATDIDLMLFWSTVADSRDEVIRTIRNLLELNGFAVLEAEKVRFLADIIKVRIKAKGSDLSIDQHKPIDISVYYGPSLFGSQHYVAQASATLEPLSGCLQCDPRNFSDILHGRFTIRLPESSDSFKKMLNDHAHILKLLIRAWSKSLTGKMILCDKSVAVLKLFESCKGDLTRLQKEQPLWVAALQKIIAEHFAGYQYDLSYMQRTMMLLKFCQYNGFTIAMRQPTSLLHSVLHEVDVEFACCIFSMPFITSSPGCFLSFEPASQFLTCNNAALVNRGLAISARCMTSTATLFPRVDSAATIDLPGHDDFGTKHRA